MVELETDSNNYTEEEYLAIENNTLTTAKEFLTKRKISLELLEKIEKLAKAFSSCGEKTEVVEQKDGELLLKQLYLKLAVIDILDLMIEY